MPSRGERSARADRVATADAAFRAVADALPHLIWIADADGGVAWANRAWRDHVGAVQDRAAGWAGVIHPDDRAAMAAAWRECVRLGSAFERELRIRRHDDGAYRWHLCRGEARRDRAGAIVGCVGTCTDIDATRAAAERQREIAVREALRADIHAALLRAAPMAEMLQRCAEALTRHLDAALTRIWILPEGARVLRLAASAGMYTHLDGMHGRIEIGQWKIGQIAQSRRPLLSNAVVGDPRIHDQDWARREGLVAFAGHPLLLGDRLHGVLALFARRELPPRTVHELADASASIALGIARAEAEQALRASERRFQDLADDAPAMIWTADAGLGRSWSSRGWLAFTGRAAADELGRGWADGIHPEDRARCRDALDAHAARKEAFTLEYRIRRHDGTWRWVLDRATPHAGHDGAPDAWLGAGIDISDQREASERLAERERFLSLVTDTLPVLISYVDAGCRYRYVSKGYERWFGRPAAEMLGRTVREVVGEEIWSRTGPQLQEAIAGQAVTSEMEARRPDGEPTVVSVSYVPDRRADGSIGGVATFIHDVTARVTAAERDRFLAEASALLSSTLDDRRILHDLARLCVPVLADWCAIDIPDGQGGLSRLAVEHVDPAKVALAADLHRRFPPGPDSGAWSVLRSGQPLAVADISDDMIRAAVADPVHAGALIELGLRSCIIVPLRWRDETFGVLTLATAETRRRLRMEDLPFVEDLARRAAIALDNARLYGEQRRSRDLAARRAEELAWSQERLSAVVGTAADGIVTIDDLGVVVAANPAAERLFGRAAADLVGQEISTLVGSPPGAVDTQRALERFASGSEAIGLRSDGSTFPLELAVGEFRLGEHRHLVAVVRDISARKQAERALIERTEALQRANAELEQFAYVASHDLREPLRMVSQYLGLIERSLGGTGDQRLLGWFRHAQDGARRMQELIGDLLDYARSGRGAADGEATADLDRVLDEVVENLAPAIAAAGATVTRDRLPTVRAEKLPLIQVVQNLVGNALKYRGEAPPRIHVGAHRDGGWWTISVRDNGIGIAPRHHHRVFELFQRLHGRDEYEGTGVGLAICKRIVGRFGGRIWLESQEGEGATFLFMVPAAQG